MPDADILTAIQEAARELIQEAGRIVIQGRSDLTVEYKHGNKRDPVTEVDRAVERYLTREVARAFPGHAVLGEEGQDVTGDHDYEWVVDPVDGTLNYIAGLPLYTISIGVLYKRVPVVGAVLTPATGELLHARRGGGALRDGTPVSAGGPTGRNGVLAALPVSYKSAFKADRTFSRGIGETRSFGSIAYELAAVAGGSIHLAAFRGPRIWDLAGGVLLVTEAGGKVVVHSRRRHAWIPLDRFTPAPGKPLRSWSLPTLAGSPDAVDRLAGSLSPRYKHPLLAAVEWAGAAAKAGYTKQRRLG